jgi:hypothetical protein
MTTSCSAPADPLPIAIRVKHKTMSRATRRKPAASGTPADGKAVLSDRADRLARIVGNVALTSQSALVKAVKLPDPLLSRLQAAVRFYVWHSLAQANTRKTYVDSHRVLDLYQDDILALPNRTPNGLLLPRRETFLSFNVVQQMLVHAFAELGMLQAFSAFQMPCNVRIVSVAPPHAGPAKEDTRPYASAKIHTDVWYGEPLSAILFNVPLLGDARAVSMDFFEPREFPRDLITVLSDYGDGRAVAETAERSPVEFEIGSMYVSDGLSLHQTIRRSPGIRLSLDFRFIARELLPGESADRGRIRTNYVDRETWVKGGSVSVLTNGDPLDGFQRRARGESVEAAHFDVLPMSAT